MTTSEEIMTQYVATEARVDRMRDKYALEEGYISEDSSPWVPFVPNVFIKHLTFDVRGSSAANVLWVQEGGTLGRHRHRGPVSGYVLEGSWRYLEYDWVGEPGDFVRESPGRSHTLYSELLRARDEDDVLAQRPAGVPRRGGPGHGDGRRVLVHRPLRELLP